VISETAEENYNQVKGRKMIAYFDIGQLQRVDVNGNGESVYFELEADTLVMGMNSVICSNMKLLFEDQNITDIVFYSPDGSFIPFHEIAPASTKLDGFNWRPGERPTLKTVLRLQPETPIMPEEIQKYLKEGNVNTLE